MSDNSQNTADLNLQFEAWLRRRGGKNFILKEKPVLPTDRLDRPQNDGTKMNSQAVTMINAKEQVLRHLRECNESSQIQGQGADNAATQTSTGTANSVTVDGTRNGVQAQQNEQRSNVEGSEVITTSSGPRTRTFNQDPVDTSTVFRTAVGQTPSGTDQAEQPSSDVFHNSKVTGIITQQPNVGDVQCNQSPSSRDSGPGTVTLSQSHNNRSQSGPVTCEEMCRPLRGGPLLPPIRKRAIPILGKKVEPTTIELYTDTRQDRPRFNLLKQELLKHPDRREAPESEVDWHIVSQQEIDHLLNTEAEQALLGQYQIKEDACTTIFVVDASFSMRQQSMRNLKETIRTYVLGNNSHPFVDNMGLVMFGPKIKVAQHLTSDKMLFLSKLDEITTGGMSDLSRALELTSALFVRETRPRFAGLELRPRIFILSDFLVSRLRTDDYCGSEPKELELHFEVTEKIEKLREKHNCDIYSVPIGKNPVLKLADQVGYENIGGQLQPLELHRYSKSYIHYKILGHLIAKKDERLGKEQLMRMAKELKLDRYVTDKDLDVMMTLARRFDKARVSYPNQEEDPDYVKIAPNLAANQLITGVIIPQERSTEEVIDAIIYDEDEEILKPITDHLPIMPSIGTRVRPGPNFMWKTPEFKDSMEGEVTQIYYDAPGWLQVQWENGNINDYRYGLDLEFDVVPVNGDIDGIQWQDGKERLVQDFTYGIRDDDPYAGDLIIQLRREIKDYPPMPEYFICQDFPPWPLNFLPRPASKPAPQLRDGLPRFLVEYFTDPDMIPSDDEDSVLDRGKINADWFDNLRRKKNREWMQSRRADQAQQNQSVDENFGTSQPGNEKNYSNTRQHPVNESNSTKQTSLLAQIPNSVYDSLRESSANPSSSFNRPVSPTILSAQSSIDPNIPLAQTSVKPTPSIKELPVNSSVSFDEKTVQSTVLSADIDSSQVVSQSSFNSAIPSMSSPAITGLATPRQNSESLRKSWSQLLNSGSGLDPTKLDTSKSKEMSSSNDLFTHKNTEPSVMAPSQTFSSPQSAVNSTIISTQTSAASTQPSVVLYSRVPKSNTVPLTKSWAQLLNASAGSNPVNSNNSEPGEPIKHSMQGPPSVISSSCDADTLISSPLPVTPVISTSQTSASPTISSEHSSVSHISPIHAEGIQTISSTERSDTSARTWSRLLNSGAGSNLANKKNSNSVMPKSHMQTDAIAFAQPPLSKCETFERESQQLNSAAGIGLESNSIISSGKPGLESNSIISSGKPGLESNNTISSGKPGLESNNIISSGKPGLESNSTISSGKPGLESNSTFSSGKPSLESNSTISSGKPVFTMLPSLMKTDENISGPENRLRGSEASTRSWSHLLNSGVGANSVNIDSKPGKLLLPLSTEVKHTTQPGGMYRQQGESKASENQHGLPIPLASQFETAAKKPPSWSMLLSHNPTTENSPSEESSSASSLQKGIPASILRSDEAALVIQNRSLDEAQINSDGKSAVALGHVLEPSLGAEHSDFHVRNKPLSWSDLLGKGKESTIAPLEMSSKEFGLPHHLTVKTTSGNETIPPEQLLFGNKTVSLQDQSGVGNSVVSQTFMRVDLENMNLDIETRPFGLTSSFERKETTSISNTNNSQAEDHHSRTQTNNESSDNNLQQTQSATLNVLSSVTTTVPLQNTKDKRSGPTGQRSGGKDSSDSVAFSSLHNNSDRGMQQSVGGLAGEETPQQNLEVSKSYHQGQRSNVQDQENKDSIVASSSETAGTHPVRQMKLQPKDKKSVDLGSQTVVGSESSRINSSVSSDLGTMVDSAGASFQTPHEQISSSQSQGLISRGKKAFQKLNVGGIPSASSQYTAIGLHHGVDRISSVDSQTTELQRRYEKFIRQRASENSFDNVDSGALPALSQRPAGSSYIGSKPSLNSQGIGSQSIGQRSGNQVASQNSIVSGKEYVVHINAVPSLQEGSDSRETPSRQMDNNSPARMSSESFSSSSSSVSDSSLEMNSPYSRSGERWVYSSDFDPGASEEARWSCPRCTYMNTSSFSICEMCNEERGASAGFVQSEDGMQQLMDFSGIEVQGQMTYLNFDISEDESQTQDRTFRPTDGPGQVGQVMDLSEHEEISLSTILEPSQHESVQAPLTPTRLQPENSPIPKVVNVETVVEQATTSLNLVRTENNSASPMDTESEESSYEEGTEGCFVWQWQDEKGQWKNYAKDVNGKLEKMYRQKRGSCVIKHNSLMERVIFKTMKQKNNELKSERDVRRVEIDPKMMENLEKCLR
ncbi:hypothetical protein ACJMK2_044154 [Sinanodonta woodiana]|uniref:RBR-type E3 ubiquitin transferase n=1 Tax=Sinanodonta woodiana TaxID=1069815 RepID=A0ABD3VZ67_SINWO